MKEITRKEHVAAYWQDRRLDCWQDDAKINLFGKPYKLVVVVQGNTLEDYRVMQGQFCVNEWLNDAEKFEVVRYINEYWPEVQKS